MSSMMQRSLLRAASSLNTRATQQLSRRVLHQPKYCSSSFHSISRLANVEAPEYLDNGERRVFGLLKDGLNPSKLEVQDISGGCGSTYALDIVSDQFTGLTLIKQHRLVKKVLEEEMKNWHGVQLKTKAP